MAFRPRAVGMRDMRAPVLGRRGEVVKRGEVWHCFGGLIVVESLSNGVEMVRLVYSIVLESVAQH